VDLVSIFCLFFALKWILPLIFMKKHYENSFFTKKQTCDANSIKYKSANNNVKITKTILLSPLLFADSKTVLPDFCVLYNQFQNVPLKN